ncbi:hypothetical protein BX666DRAFT_72390 [Dichotomocladium elegans]|nr:hypothetical protein BX666DRAFT_72390 [Dichotomocladium elegans]
MYTPDKWEILSEINSVGCITIVSLIFGRKIAGVEGPIVYVRSLTLVFYLLVWIFQLIACMAVSTNNGNHLSCMLGFFTASVVYMLARISLCLYFMEKIYIISVPETPRLRSPIYLGGTALLLPYVAIMIVVVMHRTVEVDPDMAYHCIVGYSREASIPALCYDLLVLGLCIGAFTKLSFYPTIRQRRSQQASTLILMAKRNIFASTVPCMTATVNYLVMIWRGGRERGLVSLSICTLDLTIVALVLHWVTSHYAEIPVLEKVLEPVNISRPLKLEIKQHQEVIVLTELHSGRKNSSTV